MSEFNRQQLQQAYALIRDGKKQDATRMLVDILRSDRDNADAWWLLANAATTSDKAQQALQQVLRIQPDHAAARAMLDKLHVSSSDLPSTPASQSFGDLLSGSSSSPSDSASSDPFANAPNPFASTPVDPFASAPPPRTPPPAPAPAADPFGDPFASAPRSTPQSDPYGDPFAAAPRPAPTADPFGSGGARGGYDDDPFAGVQPFQRVEERRPQQYPPPKPEKSGCSGCALAMVIVGVVLLVGCGIVVFVFATQGPALMNQIIQSLPPEDRDDFATAIAFINSGEAANAFATLQAASTTMSNTNFGAVELDGTTVERGNVGVGQSINDTLPSGGRTNHAFKFEGSSGQSITISVNSRGAALDPVVFLQDANGRTIGSNDDDPDPDASTLNSRLEITLPSGGAYTIVVSDFGSAGGDYELRVE